MQNLPELILLVILAATILALGATRVVERIRITVSRRTEHALNNGFVFAGMGGALGSVVGAPTGPPTVLGGFLAGTGAGFILGFAYGWVVVPSDGDEDLAKIRQELEALTERLRSSPSEASELQIKTDTRVPMEQRLGSVNDNDKELIQQFVSLRQEVGGRLIEYAKLEGIDTSQFTEEELINQIPTPKDIRRNLFDFFKYSSSVSEEKRAQAETTKKAGELLVRILDHQIENAKA